MHKSLSRDNREVRTQRLQRLNIRSTLYTAPGPEIGPDPPGVHMVGCTKEISYERYIYRLFASILNLSSLAELRKCPVAIKESTSRRPMPTLFSSGGQTSGHRPPSTTSVPRNLSNTYKYDAAYNYCTYGGLTTGIPGQPGPCRFRQRLSIGDLQRRDLHRSLGILLELCRWNKRQ